MEDSINSPFEFHAICTNNDGEAAGRKVSDLLQEKEVYIIRNYSRGELYGGELIGKVYDKTGKHLKFGPEYDYMKLQDRFVIGRRICLN